MPDKKRMRSIVKMECDSGDGLEQPLQRHAEASAAADAMDIGMPQCRVALGDNALDAELRVQLQRANAESAAFALECLERERAMGEQLLQIKAELEDQDNVHNAELASMKAKLQVKDAMCGCKEEQINEKDAPIRRLQSELQRRGDALAIGGCVGHSGDYAIVRSQDAMVHMAEHVCTNLLKFSTPSEPSMLLTSPPPSSTHVRRTFSDGSVYEGEWKDGRMNGRGKRSCFNGQIYEGEWKDGRASGSGKVTFPIGGNYEGEWRDGCKNGRGKMTFPSGLVYEGEWKDGKENGQGKAIWPDGTFYVGDWRDGKRDGSCKMTLSSGLVYEGEWKGVKENGRGKTTWPNGSIYEGEYKDGKANGRGKMASSDGLVYEGEWRQGNANGSGTASWSDGRVYEGEWKDHKRNGRGKCNCHDGEFYEGEYKDDKKHGRGKHVGLHGDIFEGDFEVDNYHGQGTMTYSDGRCVVGTWSNGVLMVSRDA